MMLADELDERHDRGLQYDLATLLRRRRVLQLFSGVALAAMVGCSGDDDDGGTATGGATGTPELNSASAAAGAGTTGARTATSTSTVVAPIPVSPTPLSACTRTPSETAGPFPGNGSNGPNALAQSGIVRSDVRASFGSSTTVAGGAPLEVELTLVDTKDDCRPLAGAALYLWHVDAEGRYSMYSAGATAENYLRGVQVADANGIVRFRTVFPGAYTGRWPHIHFEVYPSLDAATSSANKLATSQLALPEDVCRQVYAGSGYPGSLANLDRTPLARDGVFADGVTLQMAAVTGSLGAGYRAGLVVGV